MGGRIYANEIILIQESKFLVLVSDLSILYALYLEYLLSAYHYDHLLVSFIP